MNKVSGEDKTKQVALWLFACALVVFLMVVIGGLTRLTESGLSIVEWKPVAGAIPPITEQEWELEFAQYRTSPEYAQKNYGMNLSQFKAIFWLEFIHRLIGRLVGVIFLLPYLYFLVKGYFSRKQAITYLSIFLLGGLQGAMGWYMVKSGLSHDPRVSPYRLAAHLALALLIFGLIFIQALKLCRCKEANETKVAAVGKLLSYSLAITALVFIQIMLGALVAGNDAGLAYNTFPTMDGQWVPDGLLARAPAWANFFENPTTVQFVHRIGAYLVFFSVFFFWWRVAKNQEKSSRIRKYATALIILIFLQFTLGVLTLVHQVPVGFASLHQAVAVVVFAVSLFINHHLYVMVRASK